MCELVQKMTKLFNG
ncbi:hypothetical protein [Streptomyces griseochromogenes]